MTELAVYGARKEDFGFGGHDIMDSDQLSVVTWYVVDPLDYLML